MLSVTVYTGEIESWVHWDATQDTSRRLVGFGEGASRACVNMCVYLRRRIRRVCPGYYPLERPARLSISATIRLELELGAMDEALDGASVELRSIGKHNIGRGGVVEKD